MLYNSLKTFQNLGISSLLRYFHVNKIQSIQPSEAANAGLSEEHVASVAQRLAPSMKQQVNY